MARFPDPIPVTVRVELEPAPRSWFTPQQRFLLLMAALWVSPWPAAALILGVTR